MKSSNSDEIRCGFLLHKLQDTVPLLWVFTVQDKNVRKELKSSLFVLCDRAIPMLFPPNWWIHHSHDL